jgi:hypothetical protein
VIQLGKQGINELPSFLAAADNQLNIIWSNNYTWVMADMPGELGIEFVVYRKFLFTGFP